MPLAALVSAGARVGFGAVAGVGNYRVGAAPVLVLIFLVIDIGHIGGAVGDAGGHDHLVGLTDHRLGH